MRVQAQGVIKDHPYYPEPGDVLTVPDDVGQRWLDNSWAKVVGESVDLEIHNSTLGVTSKEVS